VGVTGIGGVFFRSSDPDSLQNWYRDHLGVSFEGGAPWIQSAGPTVFLPFAKDTDYFPQGKQWMINLRVSDLDEFLASLRKADIAIITDPEWNTPETGKFARIHDPEGNPVELWEPPVD
jgi:predicted enzyme related to lactoylglutathione lyase